MASGVITDKAAYTEWLKGCPLRKWMSINHVSILDAASRMGVSISIIQLWSKGVHFPSDDSLDKIAALMEVKPQSVKRAWRAWFAKRPGES